MVLTMVGGAVKEDEYQQIQAQVTLMGQLVQGLDLAGFLDAIDRADTWGPMVDPWLWMRAHENLAEVRRLATALKRFQDVVFQLAAGQKQTV